MWSTNRAKEVLEEANKVLEERRALGINDEALFMTAKYLDYVLTSYLWLNKNSQEDNSDSEKK